MLNRISLQIIKNEMKHNLFFLADKKLEENKHYIKFNDTFYYNLFVICRSSRIVWFVNLCFSYMEGCLRLLHMEFSVDMMFNDLVLVYSSMIMNRHQVFSGKQGFILPDCARFNLWSSHQMTSTCC